MSISMLFSLFLVAVAVSAKPQWDSRSDQASYPAWYQVPKSNSNYPSESGYDRPSTSYDRSPGYGRPAQSPYSAYGLSRGMKSPPMEYGNEHAIANNVLPGGARKSLPYYGSPVGGQPAMMAQDISEDSDRPSAILKYHPLLARRNPKPLLPTAGPSTTVPAVVVSTRKSPYNVVTMRSKQPPRLTTTTVTRGYSTPLPWLPIRLRGKTSEVPTTTARPVTVTPKPETALDYLLRILPNAELFAAIKDVVSKFRASLDQANVEQDVKKMGTQLENTWQELRRGSNGRIDRLFEHAQRVLQDSATNRP